MTTQAETWVCENPDCKAEYHEYVNGCPKCYHGRQAKGLLPLVFSVAPEAETVTEPFGNTE